MSVQSESDTYSIQSPTWNSLKEIGIQAKRLEKKNSLILIDIIVYQQAAHLFKDLICVKIFIGRAVEQTHNESQRHLIRLVIAKEDFYYRLNERKDKYKKKIYKMGAISALNDIIKHFARLNHDISCGIRGIHILRMYPSLDIDIDDNKLEPLQMVMSQCKQEVYSIKQWASEFGLFA